MMPHPTEARWQDAVQNLLAVQRPQQAEQVVRQQLARNPREVLGYVLLGFALYQQTRIEEARASVREALALNPAASEAFYVLCLIENVAGQPAARAAALTEALRLQPYNPKYLGVQARFLLHQGEPAASLVAAERGLAQNPTHAECLTARANALHAQQRWPELAEALHQLRAAHPTLPIAHQLLGREALRQEQFVAAQAHFQEVLRLSPNNSVALAGASQAIRRQLWPGRAELAFDRYMTSITEGMKFPRPQLKAWGHFLLIIIPLSLFCIPVLLALAFEKLYWRLHPDVRRLRNRPDAAISYAHQTFYRYGTVSALALLLVAWLPGFVWLLLKLGFPESSLGPGLTGGLTVIVMSIISVIKSATDMPVPEKSPLSWLLLAALVLAASLTTACWPATWPYGPPLSLLLVSSLLYSRFRALQANKTD
ncbi:tetratricopeptide repeat protein [Hymenobacter guriensis]|uniref:Tetratricopeptide repeat protein n=1 Tax=Hymenobacter guriensis TaxID=2793065 RepID=A0ABS0KXH7_9BACT|nr:hypothetical protein [Hymenobacter guriensis]MBG8552465.1 hypothetical protein [Hymenobacter guriensis]